jgi:hypothetical protein
MKARFDDQPITRELEFGDRQGLGRKKDGKVSISTRGHGLADLAKECVKVTWHTDDPFR